MTFHEKLAKLMLDRTEVDVNRLAGLERGYIGNCLASETEPGGFKALKIARYFNVPVEWLLDDAMGWPPSGGLIPPEKFSPADWATLRKLVQALREPEAR